MGKIKLLHQEVQERHLCIKYKPEPDRRQRRHSKHTTGRPQKCLNVEVGRVVPMAKTTLNIPYRLTTEMGRNVEVAHAKAKVKDYIKCTLQADHGNGGIGRLRE